jgi:hypothetical protein
MPHVVIPARKDEVVERAAAAFQPGEQGFAGRLDQLELHGLLCLLLHYDSAIPDPTAGHNVADTNLHHIAAPQLTIDRKIEESPIS